MKILFLTDLYPVKCGEKTTALTLHNFVIEWIKQGVQVDVIKPNFIFNSFLRKKPFYKTGFYNFEGVNVFNVNYHSPFLFNVDKKLSENIDINSYDVIVAHMPSGIIFADKIAKKYKKPLICGVHHSDIEVLTNPVYNIYFKQGLKNAYKNAKGVACRSFVLQQKFNNILPEFLEKTFVAASGVNIDAKMQRCIDAKINEPCTILTCANLIKRKNVDKLILAAKELNVKLKVIGDGAELNRLKKLAMGSKAEFLGRLERDKVLEEMQKADIFVLPSINETFGMVYLEAMASGCVTVCTKDDGVAGLIKDGENGFLTEPTVGGIKKTLERIMSLESLEQIIEKSLDTVRNYTTEKCAIAYLDFINSHSDN